MVKLPSAWPGGYQGEITVRNNGTATLNPWRVTFTVPSGVTIGNGWNGTFTQSGTTVTVTVADEQTGAGTCAPGASGAVTDRSQTW